MGRYSRVQLCGMHCECSVSRLARGLCLMIAMWLCGYAWGHPGFDVVESIAAVGVALAACLVPENEA